MKTLIAVALLMLLSAPTFAMTAYCKDGSRSEVRQHAGACSHHGGVRSWGR